MEIFSVMLFSGFQSPGDGEPCSGSAGDNELYAEIGGSGWCYMEMSI